MERVLSEYEGLLRKDRGERFWLNGKSTGRCQVTKKNLKRDIFEAGLGCYEARFDNQVENFKRRRALPQFSDFNSHSKFFDQLLSVKKIQELVFITKAAARSR